MFTHRELVEIAYRWVLNNTSCGFAFKELASLNDTGEIPDVIGFGSNAHSVLVECKCSRSDFLSDRRKEFRKEPGIGMGAQRFYCCPIGLIKKEELPDGWGLVYVNEKRKAIKVHNPYVVNIGERLKCLPKNHLAEMAMMYSALRRLHIRGRIDEIYLPLSNS